ncbi:hypothetical protein B0J17DRAFT_683883 [Rhizoctonia solani]|nr:hypothetical protein B0J17DRAFT_683883 [Rhizoctonia solani]
MVPIEAYFEPDNCVSCLCYTSLTELGGHRVRDLTAPMPTGVSFSTTYARVHTLSCSG